MRELEGQPGKRINLAFWADLVGGLMRDDHPDEARAFLRRACEVFETEAPGDPFDPHLARRAGRAFFLLAGLDDHADRSTEAIQNYRKAAALFGTTPRAGPGGSPAHELPGHLPPCPRPSARRWGPAGRGVAPFRKAVALRERLNRLRPDHSHGFSDSAGTYHRQGEALAMLGYRPEAVASFLRSLECLERMKPHDLGASEYRRLWIVQSGRLFEDLIGMGRRVEAAAVIRERLDRLPDDPGVALSAAGDLALAAVRLGPGEPPLAAARDPGRQRCAALAWEALRRAAARRGLGRLPAPHPRRRPTVTSVVSGHPTHPLRARTGTCPPAVAPGPRDERKVKVKTSP